MLGGILSYYVLNSREIRCTITTLSWVAYLIRPGIKFFRNEIICHPISHLGIPMMPTRSYHR